MNARLQNRMEIKPVQTELMMGLNKVLACNVKISGGRGASLSRLHQQETHDTSASTIHHLIIKITLVLNSS